MTVSVAVLGASGNVGREMLSTLDERDFPVSDVYALSSSRSSGQEVSFGDRGILTLQDVEGFDFSKVDIVLSSAGAKISEEYAPRAAQAGAIVIDNTSHFRMDPDVPLIVPEVNADHLQQGMKKNIIANPNCSTIQMVLALKPLHDAVGVERVNVSTYQSVSGAGKEAMDELFNQTRKFFVTERDQPQVFPKQIAFNVIPQIDVFMDDGQTKEEWKMAVETKKIMDADIAVNATCVRVPVFIGHALAMHVECSEKIDAKTARKLWREQEGITVIDVQSELEMITPSEIAGEDDVFISRVREDQTCPTGLNFWCVADNLRKGAALNSVQIAEALLSRNLLS